MLSVYEDVKPTQSQLTDQGIVNECRAVLERLSESLEHREDIHEFGRRVLIRGGLAVLLFGGALKGGVFGAIADHMPDMMAQRQMILLTGKESLMPKATK